MRVQLHLSPNGQPVPFTYLHQLTGALHKWLGPNDLHDAMSLYSFGRLRGGEKIGDHLHFPRGATLNISFFDSKRAWSLARGVIKDPEVAYGMKVKEVREVPFPNFATRSRFVTDGEVIIRQSRPDGGRQYLLWSDTETDEAMTRLLRRKLQAAGYDEDHQTVTVRFDRQYAKARVKLMDIKGICHRCSACPVIVEGTPEANAFAWLVGVGELTGSGFGALV